MNPKLDFLRLATWDTGQQAYVTSHLLQSIDGKWEQSKWLQYRGWRNGPIFVGHGAQGRRVHGIVNISGFFSDDVYQSLFDYKSLYATRLDIQATIAQPEDVHLDEVYAKIKRHVKSSLIQSDENDTLYVGSRASDIFTRLYEKILDRKYLRLEFELKGGRARATWKALHNGATKNEIFDFYLRKVKLPSDIKKLFKDASLEKTEHAMNAEIEKTDQNTLKWLQSLDGAMMKALANHAIGQQVADLLNGWVGFAGNLDRMGEHD